MGRAKGINMQTNFTTWVWSSGKPRTLTTVGLIRAVVTIVVPIADEGWVGADACQTLELTRAALEFSCGEQQRRT